MLLALLVFITTLSTFLGGFFALRNTQKIHTILGFTAGVLLGVVSFEVFPEIFHLVQAHHIPPMAPMIAFVVGFFGPMIWAPEANQGPLLGLFITGPLGFLLGGVDGLAYGLVRRQAPR